MPAFYFLQNNFTTQAVPAGGSFSLDVIFDTNDDTPLPFGESFQAFVYYDSSLLTFNGFSNELDPTPSGIDGEFQNLIDTADALTDGDPLTDMRFSGNWINILPVSFPDNSPTIGNTLLFTVNFSTVPGFDSGSTIIRTRGFASVTTGMPSTTFSTINAVPIPFEFSATAGLFALGLLFGAFGLWKRMAIKKLEERQKTDPSTLTLF
jgi:hypothetical protein